MLAFLVCMIPEDFELQNFLTMRESAGIFNEKNIKLEKLQLAADSVKSGPITFLTGLNSHEINYFTKILEQLHVVLDTKIDHEIEIDLRSTLDHRNNKLKQSIFLCLNIAHVTKLKDYKEVLERMVALEDYKVAEETLEAYKSGAFA